MFFNFLWFMLSSPCLKLWKLENFLNVTSELWASRKTLHMVKSVTQSSELAIVIMWGRFCLWYGPFLLSQLYKWAIKEVKEPFGFIQYRIPCTVLPVSGRVLCFLVYFSLNKLLLLSYRNFFKTLSKQPFFP